MKVFVYYNLHKKVWSVKALEGQDRGRVIDHCESILLTKGQPRVSEPGRQRVIQEQRKNVHAGMVGVIADKSSFIFNPCEWQEVTYNPYKYKSFVYKNNTLKEVDKFEFCYMENKRVWVK